MQIAYALEPNLSVQAFRDILIASTLAEPVERFESLTEPGKILSLSVFRDEAAIAEWRNLAAHRRAQARGRSEVFAKYRLRIAGVIRDYGMDERDQAPQDSLSVHG